MMILIVNKFSIKYKSKEVLTNLAQLGFANPFSHDTQLFKDNQPIRIMAQILKIYDLVLCLRCKSCELLVNSCDCKERNSVKKYDMDIYKDYLGKSIIIIS